MQMSALVRHKQSAVADSYHQLSINCQSWATQRDQQAGDAEQGADPEAEHPAH
jgi:hypothetical protein